MKRHVPVFVGCNCHAIAVLNLPSTNERIRGIHQLRLCFFAPIVSIAAANMDNSLEYHCGCVPECGTYFASPIMIDTIVWDWGMERE